MLFLAFVHLVNIVLQVGEREKNTEMSVTSKIKRFFLSICHIYRV